METNEDEAVGYGRPPRHSRWKKGQSGNAAGRPKGSRGVSAIIAAALAEKVVVTENGRRRSISKLEVAVKQLANKAATGDRHSIKLILDLLHGAEERDEARLAGAAIAPNQLQASDKVLLEAVRANALRLQPQSETSHP
jgi:hypothetical protein